MFPGARQLPVLVPRARRILRKRFRPPGEEGRTRGQGNVHGAAT